MKNILIFLIFLLICSLIFVGCGTSEGTTSSSTTAESTVAESTTVERTTLVNTTANKPSVTTPKTTTSALPQLSESPTFSKALEQNGFEPYSAEWWHFTDTQDYDVVKEQ